MNCNNDTLAGLQKLFGNLLNVSYQVLDLIDKKIQQLDFIYTISGIVEDNVVFTLSNNLYPTTHTLAIPLATIAKEIEACLCTRCKFISQQGQIREQFNQLQQQALEALLPRYQLFTNLINNPGLLCKDASPLAAFDRPGPGQYPFIYCPSPCKSNPLARQFKPRLFLVTKNSNFFSFYNDLPEELASGCYTLLIYVEDYDKFLLLDFYLNQNILQFAPYFKLVEDYHNLGQQIKKQKNNPAELLNACYQQDNNTTNDLLNIFD